jgi:hypothetical protein
MFNQSKLAILLSVFHVYLLLSECYDFLIYTIDCFIHTLYFWTLIVKLNIAMLMSFNQLQEEIKDTKGVIRIRGIKSLHVWRYQT